MTLSSPLSAPVPLPPVTKVAIIGGGGPSGIVAVRQLLDAGVRPDQIAAFEARDRAGGVWNYEANPGKMDVEWRSNGLPVLRSQREIAEPGCNGPAAMYDKMRTNLPCQVMEYRDAPFPKGTPMFPTHQQVAQYLQDYTAKTGVTDVIQWSTRVLAAYYTPGDNVPDEQRWTVESEHTAKDGTKTRKTEFASHIIVGNGHYNEPYIPSIPGLPTFAGEILHSRWWRNPQQVDGRNVVVVGSHSSGSDIARELAVEDMIARKAGTVPQRKIYQSVRGETEGLWDDEFEWAKEIRVRSQIIRADGKTLYLKDGTTIEDADVIVFATGYLFSYPFFPTDRAPFDTHPLTTSVAPAEPEKGLAAAGGHDILNLNTSDTFYGRDHTLALIGLHYLVNPFRLGETSARLIAKSFVRGVVPPLPPLLRFDDTPGTTTIGCPQEFDNQDAWLIAIGEGGDDGGPEGGWKRTPDSVRDDRAKALVTRRKMLGY